MMAALNPMNPFVSIESLHVFAAEVAQELRAGSQVAAVLGPYSAPDFLAEVNRLLGVHSLGEGQSRVLPSSLQYDERAARRGNLRLAVVQSVDDGSVYDVMKRAEDFGSSFVLAPCGVCETELSTYGRAILANMSIDDGTMLQEVIAKSDLAFLLKLVAGMCAGSPSAYRDLLVSAAMALGPARKDVRSPRPIPSPLRIARGYAKSRHEELLDNHSLAYVGKGEMQGFQQFLVALAESDSRYLLTDDQVEDAFLIGWSKGLCWEFDGVWCPDWGLLHTAPGAEDKLFESLVRHRVSQASLEAMMPVVNRYCSLSVARYLAQAHLGGDNKGELTWLRKFDSRWVDFDRATEVQGVASFVQDRIKDAGHLGSASKWNMRVGDAVDVYQMKELRNKLCHLLPHEVNEEMMGSFVAALSELAIHEENPFKSAHRASFM